ncbi:hypothetical protein EIM50_20765, partial [Pseudoxanthomonas sp. SGD-10]
MYLYFVISLKNRTKPISAFSVLALTAIIVMNLTIKKILYTLSFFFLHLSGYSQKVFYNVSERNWREEHISDSLKLDFSVFLISDLGHLNTKPKISENLLKEVSNSNGRDVLIFLGNNTKNFASAENDSLPELKLTKAFKGRTLYIPGHSRGLVNKQFPKDACSGPTEINIDNLTIITINSQWWIKREEDTVCPPISKIEFTRKLKSIIAKNRDKHILLAQHHPLYANSRHGGYFTVKDHIFPLRAIHKALYIPLPVIGSAYPILRQQGIYRQDLANKHYKAFIEMIKNSIINESNLVVASGHEKVIQLTKDGNINQVISGSSVEATKFLREKSALFGVGALGYAKLNYYTNGQCWVDFIIKDKDT